MSSFQKFVDNVAQGNLGQIGVNTNIELDNRSILNMGVAVFLALVASILAYVAITKLVK